MRSGARCFLVLTVLCATLCAVSGAQAAEQMADEDSHGTLTLLFENDLFFNTDRDYTNGVMAAYTTAPADTPDWALRAARLLPFFLQHGEVRTSYSLGQDMFTPKDILIADPPPDARPYAGFLYGALGLTAENDRRLDQLQLQLGVVGPDSYAEETQKFVHRLVHANAPQGWNTQLGNEPGLALIYERSWRSYVSGKLLGFSFDIDPHIGGAVGNVYDYVNAGAMLRLGYDLPDDYGPLRIEPSLPGSDFYEPTSGFGWYLFAGVDGRAVGHNLFLDGNTFQSSRHTDKLPLVGDLQVGAAISLARMRIAFTHVFRTKEYHAQPGIDQFGAVSVSFRF